MNMCHSAGGKFYNLSNTTISSGNLSTLRTIFIHFITQKLAVSGMCAGVDSICLPGGRVEAKGLTHHLSPSYCSETRTCVIMMIAEFG